MSDFQQRRLNTLAIASLMDAAGSLEHLQFQILDDGAGHYSLRLESNGLQVGQDLDAANRLCELVNNRLPEIVKDVQATIMEEERVMVLGAAGMGHSVESQNPKEQPEEPVSEGSEAPDMPKAIKDKGKPTGAAMGRSDRGGGSK